MYNAKVIEKAISTEYMGRNITYFEEIGSTNDYAKEWARQGAVEGSIVVADRQTAGRGRIGKKWSSPGGEGIWMSMILRPEMEPANIAQLTLLAGLSMCKAIETHTNFKTKIKWPNDIVIENKKICGILAEMGMQGDQVIHVVLGIGVNVNTEQFEEDLPHASSLKQLSGHTYERAQLLGIFMDKFEMYYNIFKNSWSISAIIEEYNACCINIGKEAILIEHNQERSVYVEKVTDKGALKVRLADGRIEEIVSGEVSVRGLYGYV